MSHFLIQAYQDINIFKALYLLFHRSYSALIEISNSTDVCGTAAQIQVICGFDLLFDAVKG